MRGTVAHGELYGREGGMLGVCRGPDGRWVLWRSTSVSLLSLLSRGHVPRDLARALGRARDRLRATDGRTGATISETKASPGRGAGAGVSGVGTGARTRARPAPGRVTDANCTRRGCQRLMIASMSVSVVSFEHDAHG